MNQFYGRKGVRISFVVRMETSPRIAAWFCMAAIFLLSLEVTGAELREFRPAHALPDGVFLQEVGYSVPSELPLTAIASYHGSVYAGTSNGLFHLEGTNYVTEAGLVDLSGKPVGIKRLVPAAEALWAISRNGGLHLSSGAGSWVVVAQSNVTDVCSHDGRVWVAMVDGSIAVAGSGIDATERLERQGTNASPFSIHRLVSHNEMVFVQGEGRLTTFWSNSFGGKDSYDFPADQGWDWGMLPSKVCRDVLSKGPALYFATDRGLGVMRGAMVTSIRGENGLPFEDTLCLASGFTNDLWIGTSHGAIRMVGGRFHYFAGRRWMPGNRVAAIAVDGSKVYLATDGGVGVIDYVPMTLAEKASYYERWIERWGQKRLGFTHKLEWDESLKGYVREVSDNDGGYSADYLAAQSFRYAATGDPAARQEATNTFHALRWLVAITGIQGFPARAVWAKSEAGHKSMQGSGGLPAEWHSSSDGKFEWKGDTSSDEITGHFFGVSAFLEHCARDAEIGLAKEHLKALGKHLVDHGWQLIDQDGKPTRWGRWDPDYFRTDEGRLDRGLQALELLSFIRTAGYHTADPAFDTAYRQLIRLDYPRYTVRQRNVWPTEDVAHFEDQLALWSYWNLLRIETNPELRAVYRRSLERTFEVIRVEQNPWFNFVYGILTGNDCEAEVGLHHLQEWPMDLRTWSYQNSHRTDLRTPSGYTSIKGGIKAFSPREREPMRWDAWTMQADGGDDGKSVMEPGGWLVAYWMGRYYGFIAPPLGIPTQHPVYEPPQGGANRYSGPTRPQGF